MYWCYWIVVGANLLYRLVFSYASVLGLKYTIFVIPSDLVASESQPVETQDPTRTRTEKNF